MSDAALTKRQEAIYNYIKDKIINRGYPPSMREIGLHFDIHSPNGVYCHLKALRNKGWIKWEPGVARSFQLVREASHRFSQPST